MNIKEALMRDAENMEEVCGRLADRSDIWQDRMVYWIAVAVLHIITYLMRGEAK